MKKRVCCLLLLVCLLLASCAGEDGRPEPATTAGLPGGKAEETAQGDFTYEVYPSWVSVKAYTGRDAVVTVPQDFANKPVLLIGESAFKGNEAVEKVILPLTLRVIDRFAFESCTSLAAIEGGARLEAVEDYAFRYSGLKEFAPSGPLYTVGRNAFYGCEQLEKVALPENVTVLREYAFSECPLLSVIDLTACTRLTALPNRMAAGCRTLTSFTVPQYVTSIGSYCFASCPSLGEMTVPAAVTDLGEGVFNGSANVKLLAPAGSAAAKYARRNGTAFETTEETK